MASSDSTGAAEQRAVAMVDAAPVAAEDGVESTPEVPTGPEVIDVDAIEPVEEVPAALLMVLLDPVGSHFRLLGRLLFVQLRIRRRDDILMGWPLMT